MPYHFPAKHTTFPWPQVLETSFLVLLRAVHRHKLHVEASAGKVTFVAVAFWAGLLGVVNNRSVLVFVILFSGQ